MPCHYNDATGAGPSGQSPSGVVVTRHIRATARGLILELMKYSYLSLPLLFLSCTQSVKHGPVCTQRQSMELYINNDSWVDTLAAVYIALNDSLLVKDTIAQRKTGSENIYKNFSICPGQHHLQVRFGRFQRDTLITLRGDQSLFVSMSYSAKKELEMFDGLAIAILEHDYNWYHRID